MNYFSITSVGASSGMNKYQNYAVSRNNIAFKQNLQKAALMSLPIIAATTTALILNNKQTSNLEENKPIDFRDTKLNRNTKYEFVTKRCMEIYEQFGVQVRFLTEPKGNIGAALTEIYNELQNFKMHNAEGKKGLTRINITDEKETYWNSEDRSINIGTKGKSLNVENIRYSLRHELVHDYDTKPELGNKFPSSFDANNIEPYINEMLNAGLSPKEIVYAFANRKELLSIVVMSDMSKYSNNFKNILIDAGMPNNVFNMNTNNAISRNIYSEEQKESLINAIKEEINSRGGVGFIKNTDRYNHYDNNLIVNLIILNEICRAFSPQKEHSKKTEKPKETENYSEKIHYKSNMDMAEINEALKKYHFLEAKIKNNTVELIKRLNTERTKTIQIRDEFFEDCKTESEKEYLVKTWLLECLENVNYNRIPYELLLGLEEMGASACKRFIDREDEARAKGIIIGKYEKSKEDNKPDFLYFTVNGKKHKAEINHPDGRNKICIINALLGDEYFLRQCAPWSFYTLDQFLELTEIKE